MVLDFEIFHIEMSLDRKCQAERKIYARIYSYDDDGIN